MARFAPSGSSISSYDLAGETARLAFADAVVGRRRINRATAEIAVRAIATEDEARLREAWRRRLLPTTLPADAPVIHLGWPTHGPFVMAPHGVYFDGYLGVAQKVLDERHVRFRRMLEDLSEAGLLLRREIATDDYLDGDTEGRIKTPLELAGLWAGALQARWAHPAGWQAFFSSSGAEAVEAALKIAHQHAYKRFVAAFGIDTLRAVCAELDIREAHWFERDPAAPVHPVFEDYPFQIVACEGAFHGRTLGALSATWSKRAHRLAYPRSWNVTHVPYNAPAGAIRARIDPRGIAEILALPGELRRVLREQRRIPKDLFAGFLAEPFQGEGGYVPGSPAFFAEAREACDAAGGLLLVDEVQTVARTGRLLMTEWLGVRPDVVATAKSMVIGITMARGDVAADCHDGWHSNTWGAGRVLDVNFAWHVLAAILEDREPAFQGLSYLENEEVKGRQLADGLDRLATRHPRFLVGHRGMGLMQAMLVRERSRVVAAAWQQGVKLLGCGLPGEVAAVRLLLLADTTAREVDQLLAALDKTFASL